MNRICSIISAATLLSITLLTSCSKSNQWSINGKITDAEANDLVIEAYDNGRWYILDSVTVSQTGNFSYSHDAAGYPDVYRLRSGETSVYFPIDSIETISISISGAPFAAQTTLSGSPQAEAMMEVDKIIASSTTDFKDSLSKKILADPASIVSYYVINRKINGKPLFDPANKNDLKTIGAVANAFNQYRPSDPRTAYLKNLYLQSRRAVMPSEKKTEIEASEIQFPEISLYDNFGKRNNLSDLASKGNVVLLNFTLYSDDNSPAFNIMLNNIYQKYHSSGLDIYQVALDTNEYEWKKVADNLPWTTVINDAADSERVLLTYNVGSIPTIFIIDRNGDIVERVTDITNLESTVARYI